MSGFQINWKSYGTRDKQIKIDASPDFGMQDPAKSLECTRPVHSQNVRPWARFLARNIDLILFATSIGFIFGILDESAFERLNNVPDIILGILYLFSWVFVESILLYFWGTTPGKSLLKIKIKCCEGESPKFYNCLNRSLKVWVAGFGAGLPVISLITLVVAKGQLTKNGITSWDKEEKFIITHEKIGFTRFMLAFMILLVFIFLEPLASIWSQ